MRDDTRTDRGPLTTNGLRVCAQQCATCIFKAGNLMQLRHGRVREMVDEALTNDSAIVCHKTLGGLRVVCRGFYDLHKRDTLMCRLGVLLGEMSLDPDV
jgi:hypothetical protein